MYDAIVVGARCAGSPTAMLLARKGYRVLLVDRAKFPSDTLSTHYIHQPGVSRLTSWGLLDAVAGSNCPPVRSLLFDLGPFSLEGSPPPCDGIATSYAPRRTVLDNILLNAAIEAGVEFRDRFTMEEVVADDGTVVGIRGHANGGTAATERGRIVVGADGLRSAVARAVAAETYDVRPTSTCAYYTYWSDVPLTAAEIYSRPNQLIIAGPTNDGQVLTIVFWLSSEFHRVRSDIEGSFMTALDLAPGLAERVRNGRRTEKFRGTADLRNQFRQSHGPGWALAGDAGYHKDPNTAQGITDAFRSAEMLAEAIDHGLSGDVDLQVALADYETRRNQAAMPMYELTCQFASLKPPSPEQQQLIWALQGNQEQINRFLGTITGTTPILEFFSPENVAQIMQGVGVAAQ